jgi:hypothetical protein
MNRWKAEQVGQGGEEYSKAEGVNHVYRPRTVNRIRDRREIMLSEIVLPQK